jgi:putative ABC transport system permease protein
MFTHLFKLIWNKKKQNFLLMLEILVSFLVMFALFSLIVKFYRQYAKPMGIDYENVWVVNYTNSTPITNGDSLIQYYETLEKILKSLPGVKEISLISENLPFSSNTDGGGVKYQGNSVQSDMFNVEDNYKQVLGVRMIEGRWFDFQDATAKQQNVIINATLKKELFGSDPAIGKLIGVSYDQNVKCKVIGVVEDAKLKGDYSEVEPGLYFRIDTGSVHSMKNILIKVSPNSDAAFEGRLYKTMANYMKNSNVEIEYLANKRISINKFTLIPMIVLLLVAGFLIINVALGLFGVLWYNINKRRGEIGLRMAVGASGRSVSGQLVAEALIIATISLVVGAFFAIQFPLLNVFDLSSAVYLTALLFSILFIYGLVLICSLYPGKQAASIYPAVALHED